MALLGNATDCKGVALVVVVLGVEIAVSAVGIEVQVVRVGGRIDRGTPIVADWTGVQGAAVIVVV